MASYPLDHHNHSSSCSCPSTPSSMAQTLEELSFERSLSGFAQKGDVRTMESLLDKGHPVDGQIGQKGHTPLHYAARSGHVVACRLLLNRGARLDVRTAAGGSSVLHSAVYGRKVEVVRMLLSQGADCMVQDADGMTAVHKAWQMGEKEIAEMLNYACQAAMGVRDMKGRLPRECGQS